ncbi:MAG: type IV toxin-antitoxin system AbiEi family antitoxin domain-containing protein [Thermoplasmataceae archaeon]
MNKYKLLRLLQGSGLSVFSPIDIKRITKLKSSGVYSVIRRLTREELVFGVEKGKYSVTRDPFIVASQIQQPAYISFLSGLYILGATDQVVNRVQVVSSRRRQGIVFENTAIDFINLPSDLMFGYKKINKENSYIMVGELEKIILDFLYKPGIFGITYAMEAMRTGIDVQKLDAYLKRVRREAVLARAGYLLNKLGFEINFQRTTNTLYKLNPQSMRNGKFDQKWKVMVNEVIE